MKTKRIFGLLTLIICMSLFTGCPSETDLEEEPTELFTAAGDENYVSPHVVEISAAENQSSSLSNYWYNDSSFYHIWVKSFNDSDEDGCGDFKGITEKLDYIKGLGFDAIWLSPIFDCAYKSKFESDNMHGYDTVDYYNVNDYFGTEEDLIELIKATHDKGMKIIFDFVPNHTSDKHDWFISSANKTDKEDWYMWSNTQLSWNPGMGTSNTWYLSTASGSQRYYYSAFAYSGMPDLNYNNNEVREEMKNVVRWWLNKGFDGLRIDAARYLIEEENNYFDTDSTHKWFAELRKEVIDKYSSPKFMVCEAWIEGNTTTLNKYFGSTSAPEFNMVFDFNAGRPCITSVDQNKDLTNNTLSAIPSLSNTSYGTFLGNHDEYYGRIGTKLNSEDTLIKQATALSILRPTVSFVYYGNEIGQPEENKSGDIRLRGNFDWDLEQEQESDDYSILNLNKALLTVKNTYKTLRNGSVTKLETTDDYDTSLAYFITGEQRFLCVYNFSSTSKSSISFNQSSVQADTVSSILIGDTASSITFTSDNVTVTNLAPYSYRLYLVGDDTKENIFDDETYIENAQYTESPVTMYIRGDTINDWDKTLMTRSFVETGDGYDVIYSITLTLDSGADNKFKFDQTGDWAADTNWGLDLENSGNVKVGSGTDISYTSSEAGDYTITFNYSQLTYSVVKVTE